MAGKAKQVEGATYQIVVQAVLDESWSVWLDGLTVTPLDNGDTQLRGLVRDQAALYGLLIKIRDLGLSLVEVKREGCKND